MSEAPGPINFTMFLTMFGEKLNGTDPEDVIRNAFACFDEEAAGTGTACTAPCCLPGRFTLGHATKTRAGAKSLGTVPKQLQSERVGRGVFGKGGESPTAQPSHSVPC